MPRETVYDEIEIEDFKWDPRANVFHYPCPCGDRFEISKSQMRDGEDIATCPSCSLIVRVIYEWEDYEDYDSGEEEDGEAEVEEETEEAEERNEKELATAFVVSSSSKTNLDTNAVTSSSPSGKQLAGLPQEEPPSILQSDDKQLETLVQHLQVTTIDPGKGKEEEKVVLVTAEEEAVKKEGKGEWLGVW
ncbi:hypothetical protein QFC21_003440 [Naganishia friedmannii]|uniref:Uncharacterized protein n=1 Tax=Naganishia friedmannii TaxID=89922 RepID=A0ACC2VR47_9TREE|nr:hypothetical protein QFC21_003440 [Naganishia friedmannii]